MKTVDQIQAEKDALDAAKRRQLDPGAPKPLQVAKTASPATGAAPAAKQHRKGKAKPAVAD